MQIAWLFPVVVVVAVVALVLTTRPVADASSNFLIDDRSGRDHNDGAWDSARKGPDTGVDLLVDLEAYVDPDFGFTMAIPVDWVPIVAAESDEDLASLEPGYAIGFESPMEHRDDVFTDYLMVEILPGDEPGLFETDGSKWREVTIDGRSGFSDSLSLPRSSDGMPAVDLVIRQAAIKGLGYTIGLYAVGEPHREAMLERAFKAMLRTFRLNGAPFDVS